MYGSKTEYSRNAIAMKMAYAGKSKICRYEIPYSVTGAIIADISVLHTGLKDKPKDNNAQIGILERRKSRMWSDCTL
jgi:hypothetical protein